ncbi:MAG: hypothetical protein JMDDDDMK_01145 [Acidobacteria bacterium]|nr:hypothetical protein [Acidobacteriota bacterium]
MVNQDGKLAGGFSITPGNIANIMASSHACLSSGLSRKSAMPIKRKSAPIKNSGLNRWFARRVV